MTDLAASEEQQLNQLLELIDHTAEQMGLALHAVCLVGTYGSAVADWGGSDEHRAAIADRLMTAAAKTRMNG